MIKREIIGKISKSLGLSYRLAEYYTSFILDLIILESERTGKVKIDSHLFYKRTTPARQWKDKLFGVVRKTPELTMVSYRNTSKFRNQRRTVKDD